MPDAYVVGAGPNGLAAAIELARAGLSVTMLEASETVGGGARSAELTLPGFVHDVCSGFHPSAAISPFFRSVDIPELVQPDVPLAHPLDDGSVVLLERSVEETAKGLGRDAAAWRRSFGWAAGHADAVAREFLGPLLHVPAHPLVLARFGLGAVRSARALASRFSGERARALVAGLAGHAVLPLDRSPTAGVALLLGGFGHAVGWPLVRGGSQELSNALAGQLLSLGATIETGRRVESLDELLPARAVMCDIPPRELVRIAGSRLPARGRRRYERFRHGPGVFKADFALDGPVPWKAPECARAGTVHLGGAFEEIAAGERDVWQGVHPERPLVLAGQQSLFDQTRAPAGKHTLWTYCHVPVGSTVDMTERIEQQVERFAPGFRDLVLARSVRGPAEIERHNPACIGGDITGGVQDLRQTFARPSLRSPYATPVEGVFLCSSSTPPGAGVHGMCGSHSARAALRSLR